jgi:hypothetical protein
MSRLQGTASLGRNRTVTGATVLVRPRAESSRVYVTATDERGRFVLAGLADGEYAVAVWREGLQPVSKAAVAVKYPFRAVVEVLMKPLEGSASPVPTPAADAAGSAVGPAIHLHGEVRDRDGEPIEDVVVRFTHREARADPRTVRTDVEGAFEIDLPAGAWHLLASGIGFLPLRAALAIEADTELVVSMIRQPADHDPAPLDLMPVEEPIPPEGLEPAWE